MSTSARFGLNMPKNKDNTDQILNNDYQTPAYAATLNIVTKAAHTVVKPATLTGALTINIAVGTSTSAPFVGDKIEFLFTGDATARTITYGTGVAPQIGTLALGISKRGFAQFVFDGTAWMQIINGAQA